jgi:DnaK suppressor protein
MASADLERYRKRLERDRALLLAELAVLASEGIEDLREAADPAEQASGESLSQVAERNRERVEYRLREVERALGRIAQGTYGTCEETGEKIDPGRLEAYPAARLSLTAQQRRERRN